MRTLYYNFVLTGASVAVVVVIGGIQAFGLAGDQLGLRGKFWDSISALNGNFNGLGFAIVGLFILTWIVSLIIYRYCRVGDILSLCAKELRSSARTIGATRPAPHIRLIALHGSLAAGP